MSEPRSILGHAPWCRCGCWSYQTSYTGFAGVASATTTAEQSSQSSDSRLGGEAGKEKPVPVESLLDAEDYAVMAMDDDDPGVVVEGE